MMINDRVEKEGYTYYSFGECPQYYAKIGTCSRDDHYLKCDAAQWCKNNGYNTQTCSLPSFVDGQCPNGQPYYKQCKEDRPRACREQGYVNSCSSGYSAKAVGSTQCGNTCYTCVADEPDDPCDGVTGKTCASGYHCSSYGSCGECTKCEKDEVKDPCDGITCPTAKSCSYGCASYSTATSCCSRVCTLCKTTPCPPPACEKKKKNWCNDCFKHT